MSYEGDPEIAKWLTNTDFRRALSLAIDRDQINEAFFLGLGTPGTVVPAETHPHSPGGEYRTLWHTLDPDKANQMLDELGLTEKDAEGYRLRTDNGERLEIEVVAALEAFLPFVEICEMIRNDWKEIGVELRVEGVERSHGETMILANEHQMWMWEVGDNLAGLVTSAIPNGTGGQSNGPLYADWFDSRGAEGKEPPPRMREVMDMWYELAGFKTDEEVTAQVKEMWKIIADEVWTIGTVGIGPIIFGTRIVNRNMGNVAQRQIVNTAGMTPGLIRSEQFYYKQP